jgi:hypothetical protein
VNFGQPDGIEPPALGSIDLLEGSRECLGLALARPPLELVEHAEFESHLGLLLSYCYLPARAKAGASPKDDRAELLEVLVGRISGNPLECGYRSCRDG